MLENILKTYERESLTVRISSEPDYDPDLSTYGEYTDQDHDFVIDRKTGFVLGPRQWSVEKKFHGEAAMLAFEDHPEEFLENVFEVEIEEDEENHGWWTVWYSFRPILADIGQSHAYFRHDGLRYFKSFNYFGHGFRAWGEGTGKAFDEQEERRAEKHDIYPVSVSGLPESDDLNFWREILYFVEDYKRMEDYNMGYWHSIGIRIEILDGDGNELAEETVWGFESDYQAEAMADMEHGITHQFERGEVRTHLDELASERYLEEMGAMFQEGYNQLEFEKGR